MWKVFRTGKEREREKGSSSQEQSHLRRVLPVYRLPIRHPPAAATRMTTAAGRDAHRSSPLFPQAAATPQAPPPDDVPAPLPRRHRGPGTPADCRLVLLPILLALVLVPPRELLAPLISSQRHSIPSGFRLAIALCRCFPSDPKAWPTCVVPQGGDHAPLP